MLGRALRRPAVYYLFTKLQLASREALVGMEEDLSLRYDNGTGEQAPGGAEAPGGGLSSVHQRPQPHGFLVQLYVQDEAVSASRSRSRSRSLPGQLAEAGRP